jgi:hypothetical protein
VRFRAGQRVCVSDRPHEGHHRTPGYLKGRTGVVERLHGRYTNPETRAYGESGLPKKELYLVRFEGRDAVYADIFEHWLEEAE